jgi:phosphoribosylglycinamide formyltransferase 1
MTQVEVSVSQAVSNHPLDIGILLSGSGTNFQAILREIEKRNLNARICLVVSSRPDAAGIMRAGEAGIPTLVMEQAAYENPLAADERIAAALLGAAEGKPVEYVVMAGYMRKVTSVLLDAFPDHIINLHPALLPAFPGPHAIQDAFDAGVKVTGVTVHIANETYDEGPIIAQHPVRINEGDTIDTLESRIHVVEHALYPKTLQLFAERRVSIDENRHVSIAPKIY